MTDRFAVTSLGRLLFARGLPGFAAIGLGAHGWQVAAGVCLALAALGDLLVDSWASRRRWSRTESDLQIEGFVDFACFVWAPVQFAVALGGLGPLPLAAALAFAMSGAFRLARFNVEGMSNGGYRGLPVTYAGVLVPLAALAAAWTDAFSPTTAVATVFAAMAALMASSRFTTPRVSV